MGKHRAASGPRGLKEVAADDSKQPSQLLSSSFKGRPSLVSAGLCGMSEPVLLLSLGFSIDWVSLDIEWPESFIHVAPTLWDTHQLFLR